MAGINPNDTVATGNPTGVATIQAGDKLGNNVQYYNLGGTTYQNSQYASSPTPVAPTGGPTTTPVTTTQPNPATVNASPNTSAAPLGNNYPGLNFTPNAAGKAALAQAQASGPPPQTAAEANPKVNDALTANTPPPSSNTPIVQQTLANDPGYQKLLQDATTAFNTVTQGQSLLDQYKQMETDAGIPGINTELLNTQAIINGTEQNIRDEVSAAGGFSTDSQVLALANSRNKTLIQNYNNLLATKTNAEQQINTMIGLAGQDKQNAIATANQQLNIDQQLNDYAQKFQANAQQAYQNVISTVGYSGLYQELANDPNSLALTEETLGLQPGQLKTLADQQASAATQKVLSQYNITSPYVLSGQTVINSQTGESYTSPQDFQQKTGMTLDQANAKQLIKPLGATSTQEQQNFDNQIKQAQLGISQAQLGVSQYNAETSRINATKDSAAGVPNSPGYDPQGQKYTTSSAQNEIINDPTTGWNQIKAFGPDGKVNPQTYNQALSWWVSQGLSAADFKAEFGGYINQKHKGDYNS